MAIVWSDTIPADAFQFKRGKFGCVLYLFAEASTRGKIAGGSRESIICTGGRASMGFGTDFDASDDQLDHHTALFSKGLKSVKNRATYQAEIEAAPKKLAIHVRIWVSVGHCSAELAREWILHGFPRYDIPYTYVLFKPLSRTSFDDNIRAVIFPVNPIELSGLVTLAGSVMQGTDSVRVPQGYRL